MNNNTAIGIVDDREYEAILSETSPLLRQRQQEPRHVSAGESGSNIPSWLKRRAIGLVYAYAFLMMFATYLQPAAKTQLYEDIICRRYYQTHGAPSDGTSEEALCKIQPVQSEVALIKGYELFSQVLPNLLCTIPFGMLADSIGRKWVMGVSSVGVILSEMWVQAVCYWTDVFPTRLILVAGLFMVIGGGVGTVASLLHVMVTDVAEESERSQIFMFLHASSVTSGVLAPLLSAALMERGHVWPVILAGQALLLVGTFIIIPLMPETINLRERNSQGPSVKPPGTLRARIQASISSMSTSLWHNRPALLLLVIYVPTLFARDAFALIGLLYTSNKFGVRFSLGNLLLSLQQAIQVPLLVLIIPTLTFLLISQRSPLIRRRIVSTPWDTWRRDRAYLIASVGLLAGGNVLLGLAPTLWLAIVGLIGISLAAATASIALSMLGTAVGPDHVAAAYSAALMMATSLENALAPLGTELFSLGMRLGWQWIGLPFLFTAAIMTILWVLTFFVDAEKPEIDGGEGGERQRSVSG